jgi:hypothetical protein
MRRIPFTVILGANFVKKARSLSEGKNKTMPVAAKRVWTFNKSGSILQIGPCRQKHIKRES